MVMVAAAAVDTLAAAAVQPFGLTVVPVVAVVLLGLCPKQ